MKCAGTGTGRAVFCSNIILAMFIVVPKVILVQYTVTVRNNTVGTTICETVR